MGSIPQGLPLEPRRARPRERLALYLRGRGLSPKALARETALNPKTAENLLDGHWPSDGVMASLVTRFGRDLIEAVFGPDIDVVEARLRAELREMEEHVEQRRARLRAVAGAAMDLDGREATAGRRVAGLEPVPGARP